MFNSKSLITMFVGLNSVLIYSTSIYAMSTPRVILEAGGGSETYGFGDLLVPLIGNDFESLYIDP